MNNKLCFDHDIFITGTGTDIGKTYVCAQIVKSMRDSGLNAGYYKPALSGAIRRGNKLIPGDAEYVCQTAGINIPAEQLVSYTFEPAVSPHLAARWATEQNNDLSVSSKQALPIDLDTIEADFQHIKQIFDYVVVEGAGGIACPFRLDSSGQILLPEVIQRLKLNTVLVADAGLGTINSVVLTVEYIQHRNIKIEGIILNRYNPENLMHVDNKNAIELLTNIPIIAIVP